MVQIEIRFAQLRDRLYIERMADAHRETAAIQQGPRIFSLTLTSGQLIHPTIVY